MRKLLQATNCMHGVIYGKRCQINVLRGSGALWIINISFMVHKLVIVYGIWLDWGETYTVTKSSETSNEHILPFVSPNPTVG